MWLSSSLCSAISLATESHDNLTVCFHGTSQNAFDSHYRISNIQFCTMIIDTIVKKTFIEWSLK